MKLSGLAACIVIAAGLLPWIPEGWAPALVGIPLLGIFTPWKTFRWLCLGFSLSLSICLWRTHPAATDLRNLLKEKPQSVRLRFEIRGDSETLRYSERETEIRTPVRAISIYHSGAWHDATGRLQLRRSEGTDVEVLTGTLWEAAGVVAPGNFSYVGLNRANWNFRPDPGALQAAEGEKGSAFLAALFRVRRRLSQNIHSASQGRPETVATLQALLLGQRSELDPKTVDRFARTGMIHLFAISGLHLGMLAGLLLLLCRWAGVRPAAYYLWVIPVLSVFTLYTGLRASALRALIMISCLLVAAPLKRKANVPSAFALALVLILLLSPAQVYDLGFQYSFLLVGSLLAFGNICSSQLEKILAADPWEVESPGRLFRKRYLWPRVQGIWMVTVLCFLISAPLTAYTFNLFSPVGLLGNLLAVPLAFMILATGFPLCSYPSCLQQFPGWYFFPPSGAQVHCWNG